MAIFIGIDPGVHTGLAVWDSKVGAFTCLATLPLHKALEKVSEVVVSQGDQHDRVEVVVEDARQRRWLPKERNLSQYRGRLQGAGSIKRDCAIWEDYLTDKHIPFRMVPPSAGRTKWSEDYFKAVTGYDGRTSNHARDAAVLVFGQK